MPGQYDHNDIVARAQELIDEAQRQLDASDDFYRSQGLDPAKVRAVLQAQATPQTDADARTAFEADMQAIEQEVAEAKARLSSASAAAAPVRRPRPMV